MSEYEESSDLLLAIASYRSNDSDHNLGVLYQSLVDARFLVPVIFDPKPVQKKESDEVELSANTKVHFYTMKNAEGKRYYLVFSAYAQLKAWSPEEKPDTVTLSFDDLVKLLQKDATVHGLLVDPAEGNMVFEKELLFAIKEADEEAKTLH